MPLQAVQGWESGVAWSVIAWGVMEIALLAIGIQGVLTQPQEEPAPGINGFNHPGRRLQVDAGTVNHHKLNNKSAEPRAFMIRRGLYLAVFPSFRYPPW